MISMAKSLPNDYKFFLPLFSALALISLILVKFTTPYMTFASFSYLCLVCGVFFHSNKRIHIPFMLTGVLIDITLVLILEIKRSAIASALGDTLNTWQKGHILFSTLAVVLYIPTIIYGARAAFEPSVNKKKRLHLYLGRAAFFFRTGGFFLMFSLLEHVKKVKSM